MGKKSFAVIGLGKFGQSIVMEMMRAGVDVLAIDMDEERVKSVAEYVTCAVQADVHDIDAMDSLGISNMDGVVIGMTGSIDSAIMATIYAKEAGVPYILVKVRDEIHERILKKVGADRVVIPERESGIRVARNMVSGNFLDFIELSDRVKMIELKIRTEWIGHTLRELDLRKKHAINVIAIRKDGELIVNLDPDQPLDEETTLLVTVDKKDMENLLEDL